MAKLKFEPIDIDSIDTTPSPKAEAQKEADRTGQPVAVKGVGTAGTPRLTEDEIVKEAKARASKVNAALVASGGLTAQTLETLVRQQQNIWEKLCALELLVTAQWPKKEKESLKDFPKTTNGGHPIAANGMVAKWQEVPSKELLLQAAKAYIGKHGKDAYDKVLAGFKAKKLAEVTKDEDQAALMEKLNGN